MRRQCFDNVLDVLGHCCVSASDLLIHSGIKGNGDLEGSNTQEKMLFRGGLEHLGDPFGCEGDLGEVLGEVGTRK